MFKDQTILITGGTGSWGHQLTRALLVFQPRQIRIFSRNELSQVNMRRLFPQASPLRFIIGDVRDYEAVKEACKDVDYVFHLAALKHVPICELQPEETLKTNVIGTQNIVHASIACGVKKVIDVSTDKAVEPINFYGITKAIGEKLILHANEATDTTRFVCIRSGNVLGSNGSVVPLFIKQIKEDRKITITSKDMTRFFLTLQDAISLLLHAATIAIGGETFVMKMASCKISDLATVLGKHYANQSIKTIETGIRPGEKFHEVLVSRCEARNTYRFNDQYYVILPTYASEQLTKSYKQYSPFEHSSYESSMNLMTIEELEQILKKGGFLN